MYLYSIWSIFLFEKPKWSWNCWELTLITKSSNYFPFIFRYKTGANIFLNKRRINCCEVGTKQIAKFSTLNPVSKSLLSRRRFRVDFKSHWSIRLLHWNCWSIQTWSMFYSLDKLKPKTKTKNQIFWLLTFWLCSNAGQKSAEGRFLSKWVYKFRPAKILYAYQDISNIT